MKRNKNLNCNDIIFLLGAGASVDAGMPMVDKLTEQLKNILHEISDANRKLRPDFKSFFEQIAEVDPSVEKNYERFFEWLDLLNKSQKDPFNKLLDLKIPILKLSGELSFVIGDGIKRILGECATNPDYLKRFGDFIPQEGRLKIFSLNYDCCIEDACHSAGIDLTTGFDPETKKWKPALFKEIKKGINLYKLHGSLRWFRVTDNRLPKVEFMELDDGNCLPSEHFKIPRYPELILGPWSKIQPDDPFITLFYEFHIALQHAKVCIIIGYSGRDEHIKTMLGNAIDNGLSIIDINPNQNTIYCADQRYKHIPCEAKKALLEEGLIKKKIQELKEASQIISSD
ncbi:MAG: SIR2 family protein [Nitrospinae bacterium]|nr:SIR2 family protein [Nitrospinota bacterium]